MNNQPQANLRHELKLAGASGSEINELLPVASALKQLKTPNHTILNSNVHRRRWASWPKIATLGGMSALCGLALGTAIVIVSQTVLPGSWLYPVQKLSDNVAVAMQPRYRGTIMMKRAQQVNQLVAEHANSRVVLSALTDYRIEAAAYKFKSTNYAVFEYCRSNLQQAATMSTGRQRQAIIDSLLSLKNV